MERETEKGNIVADELKFEELRAAVAELTEHVRKIALGMQGLAVDEHLAALGEKLEKLRG